jgi:hypothetical protein
MKTNIKFPDIPMARREHFVHQRCTYLGDNEVHKAVIKGRFVFAWDGGLDPTVSCPTLGVLEAVTMNKDGSRTYTITSEYGLGPLDYQNAVVLREQWCPQVAVADKFGQYSVRRWIGLQEREDGKVYAIVTDDDDDDDDDDCSRDDPSTLILLDDCKVGLPEREEA